MKLISSALALCMLVSGVAGAMDNKCGCNKPKPSNPAPAKPNPAPAMPQKSACAKPAPAAMPAQPCTK